VIATPQEIQDAQGYLVVAGFEPFTVGDILTGWNSSVPLESLGKVVVIGLATRQEWDEQFARFLCLDVNLPQGIAHFAKVVAE
jgi:hypothetical protein